MSLVITFHNTTAAMAAEVCLKQEQMPGRLIPVPSSIKAGCGLAWMAPAAAAEPIAACLNQADIRYEAMQNCYL